MKHETNRVRIVRTLSVWSLIVLGCLGTTRAQTPLFTYQGRLTDGANPANDSYEMQFSLFGSPAGDDQFGTTITHSPVPVANGVFTVQLDFSPATPFATGADRWLQIAVRKVNGPPEFTILLPRQQITSSPYSIRSTSTNAADSLSSACVGCVNDTNVSDTLTIGATSTVSDSALSAQVARLDGAQTITGDWVNTANPWADNEVSNNLTIGPAGTVSDAALSGEVAHLNAAETITNDWINTANPWTDNEVSDALTLNGGTVNNTIIGGTTSAAGTFTTLALNGGAGTNISLAKSGLDRSSAVPEVFNIQNSGAGTMTLQVDGVNVITTTTETFVNTTGDTMGGALNMNNNVITNIGAAGTDFSPTGGLTLADSLQLAASETISNSGDTITFTGAAGAFSLSLATGNPTLSSSTGSIAINDTLNLTSNTLSGTTAVIDFTNFDVASNGNVTAPAGTFTSLNANSLDRSVAGALTIGSLNATNVAITPATTISGTLTANSNTTLGDAATDTLTINAGPVSLPNATSAADALVLGVDANLYRSAADTLRTDDSLLISGSLTVGATGTSISRSLRVSQVNFNIATIAADSCLDTQFAPAATAAVGSECVVGGVSPTDVSLTCYVAADGSIQLRACNVDSAPNDPGVANFSVRVFEP